MKENKKTEQMHELLENPKVKAWRTLMSAYNQIYRYLESELLKENCSISRFQIFFHLYFDGPKSATEIAQSLNVTRGNVSTFLRRLEQDGLIKLKSTGERGGKQLVDLSSKGKSLFENSFPDHIKRVISVMPELSKTSLNSLNQIKIRP